MNKILQTFEKATNDINLSINKELPHIKSPVHAKGTNQIRFVAAIT